MHVLVTSPKKQNNFNVR